MRIIRLFAFALAALSFGAALLLGGAPQTTAAEKEKPVKRDYSLVTAPPAPEPRISQRLLVASKTISKP